jgi:hypothetical protein
MVLGRDRASAAEVVRQKIPAAIGGMAAGIFARLIRILGKPGQSATTNRNDSSNFSQQSRGRIEIEE